MRNPAAPQWARRRQLIACRPGRRAGTLTPQPIPAFAGTGREGTAYRPLLSQGRHHMAGFSRRLGRSRRSPFRVEEARSRARLDRGGAMLGMPFGPGTAHVVKLGTVGIEERLDEAEDAGELSSQHCPCGADHLDCFSRHSHHVLLPARSPAFWPFPGLTHWSLEKTPGFSRDIRPEFVKMWCALLLLY